MTVQVVELKNELQGNAKFAEDVIAAAIARTPESHPAAIGGGIDRQILADNVVIGNIQAVGYELDRHGAALVQFACLWLNEGSGPSSWFARGVQDYVIRNTNEYGASDELVLGPLRVALVKGGIAIDDMVIEYMVTLETARD